MIKKIENEILIIKIYLKALYSTKIGFYILSFPLTILMMLYTSLVTFITLSLMSIKFNKFMIPIDICIPYIPIDIAFKHILNISFIFHLCSLFIIPEIEINILTNINFFIIIKNFIFNEKLLFVNSLRTEKINRAIQESR
jgi:hypothetical protein